MSQGGRLVGDDTWLVRVRALRVGDMIRCVDWNGGFWTGGETQMVISEPESSGERDGFYRFYVEPEGCELEQRELAMRPDDEVCLTSRNARVAPTYTTADIRAAVKIPQLSLLGETVDPLWAYAQRRKT